MAYPHSDVSKISLNLYDETNDDDEFGEFTSAVSLTPTTDQLQSRSGFPSKNSLPFHQIKANSVQAFSDTEVFVNPIPDSDEEFGDFCREPSQVPERPTQSESTTKFQPNYNIDLETDTTSTQLSWNSVHQLEESFTVSEVTNSNEATYSNDDVPNSNVEPNSDLFDCIAPEDAVSDDEFGEFTGASHVVAATEEPQPESVNDESSLSAQLEETVNRVDVLQILEDEVDSNVPVDDYFTNSIPVDDYFTHSIPVDDYLTYPEPEDDYLTYSEPVDDFSSFPLPVDEFSTPSVPVDDYSTHCVPVLPVVPTVPVLPATPVESTAPVVPAVPAVPTDTTDLPAEDIPAEPLQIDWDEVNPSLNPLDTDSIVEDTSARAPEPVPQVNDETSENLVDEDDDDFGDFADFQVAPFTEEKAVDDDEDDEFDNFNSAIAAGSEPSAVDLSPEHKIQQLLSSILPFESPTKQSTEASWKLPPAELMACGGGAAVFWSRVKEVESTPALSFQWRHSTAHRSFLSSLRIDSQSMNSMCPPRWHNWSSSSATPVPVNTTPTFVPSPMNGTSNSVKASMDSVAAVPVTLDLDFFLSPSSTSSTSTTTPSNLLESIEKEILSPTPIKEKIVSSTAAHQLDDIFDLQFDSSASTHCQATIAIDLLQ